MLRSLTILLAFQIAGEVLQALLGLPVPGPVLGMLLLLTVLILRGRVSPGLADDAQHVLRYLPLILIPPSVGIMDHWGLLANNALAVGLVIVVTTVLSLLVAAGLLSRLSGRS
ncbi:MAG: CidA/LrgA family protein [Oceanococcus sp.]|jgi:holin-like protein